MHVLIFPCEHYVKNCPLTYIAGQFADSPTTFDQVVLQMTDVNGVDYFPHTKIVDPIEFINLKTLTVTSATLVPLSASLTQTSAFLTQKSADAIKLSYRLYDTVSDSYI